MANKAGQIIRFATLGAYESVEGGSCSKCVAFVSSGKESITSLCKAICSHSVCHGIHWKELDSSTKSAPEPVSSGSVYTIYFQHIQSGTSLLIECPAISVAQDLWDLFANHPSFKLQCLRP